MDKKKMSLPIKVTVIGCIIGLIIAGIGGFKQFDSKKINKEREEAAVKASQAAINAANARLDEIVKEYDSVKAQYEAKSNECDAINIGSNGWLAAKNKCNDELLELQVKINNLEFEDQSIKMRDYTAYYQMVEPMSYQIFYIIGASVAGAALLGAFIIYLVKGKKTYN